MSSLEPGPLPPGWTRARRLAFRFAFVYLGLYFLPAIIELLPVTGRLSKAFLALLKIVVPPFGRHVLRIDTPVVWHESGSGDTLFDWVSLALFAATAALATAVWSLLTHRREHPRLLGGLRVYLRYALAATMLSYGLGKVIPTQFPPLDPVRLMEPYGAFSPMGVVWAFMGTSTAYQIISGLGETVGGLLLFFRRTTTAGALLLLGVMGNVVLLNFCYDVPVKQYSLHLWLAALFLAGPDLKPLFELLVRRRAPHPPAVDWRIADRRWRLALGTGKGLLVASLLLAHGSGAWQVHRQYGAARTPRPFEGLWAAEADQSGGPGWRRLAIGAWSAAAATADEPYLIHGVKYDEPTHKLTLYGESGPLAFQVRLDGDQLHLEGPFELTLRRVKAGAPLVTRGFHWVQEYPFNR